MRKTRAMQPVLSAWCVDGIGERRARKGHKTVRALRPA